MDLVEREQKTTKAEQELDDEGFLVGSTEENIWDAFGSSDDEKELHMYDDENERDDEYDGDLSDSVENALMASSSIEDEAECYSTDGYLLHSTTSITMRQQIVELLHVWHEDVPTSCFATICHFPVPLVYIIMDYRGERW